MQHALGDADGQSHQFGFGGLHQRVALGRARLSIKPRIVVEHARHRSLRLAHAGGIALVPALAAAVFGQFFGLLRRIVHDAARA